MRQRRQRVAECLAAVAVRGVAIAFVEVLENPPEQWNLLDRGGQRFAGPQPDMNSDRRDLAILPDRHRDQIERDPAVDR